MSDNKAYCTAPWNGLTIREDGHVRTCCAGQDSLLDLNNESILTIGKNLKLEKIKLQLLNGEIPSNCQLCVDTEKISNHSSLRHHYMTHYPAIDNELTLKFVDVRWTNRCNLSCVYCGPTFSSTWQQKLNMPTVT
jgi:uncharacterized radical SAM superfamily Fe-S cluster-containing enzyme